MEQPKHTPGPMKIKHLRDTIIPGYELDRLTVEYGHTFEVGDAFCGASINRPEKVGFSITGICTDADAARLKLCWDSHSALVKALRYCRGQFESHAGEEYPISVIDSVLAIADPQPDTEESDLERARR